jgi:hypothetical protein
MTTSKAEWDSPFKKNPSETFSSALGWGAQSQTVEQQHVDPREPQPRSTSWMHEWDLQVVLAQSLLEHQHLPDEDLELIPWARAVADLQYHIQTRIQSANDVADNDDETMNYFVDALEYYRAGVSAKLEHRMHGSTYASEQGEESKQNGGAERDTNSNETELQEARARRESMLDRSDTRKFLELAGEQGPPTLELIIHNHAKAQRALARQRQRLKKAGSRVAPKVMEELYLLTRQEIAQGNETLDLKNSRSAQRIFSRLPVREAHVIGVLAEQIMRENRYVLEVGFARFV